MTPAQPANFLFTLDSPNGPGSYLLIIGLRSLNTPSVVRESLSLCIKYRMLREGDYIPHSTDRLFNITLTEVESIVETEVRSVIEETGYSSHHRIIVVSKLIGALESDAAWVDMYGVTGELVVPDVFKEDGVIGELLKESQIVSNPRCFQRRLFDLKPKRLAAHRHPESPTGFWREIKIPVDVPFMNVRLFSDILCWLFL